MPERARWVCSRRAGGTRRGAASTYRRDAPWRVGRTLATGNGTRHVYLTGLLETIRSIRPTSSTCSKSRSAWSPCRRCWRATCSPRTRRWSSIRPSTFHAAGACRIAPSSTWCCDAPTARTCPNADVPPILRSKGMRAPVDGRAAGRRRRPLRTRRAAALLDSIPRPRIGFVGRLEPVKGLPVLLDAFAQLRCDASLVVAGDGPERSDCIARRALARRARFQTCRVCSRPWTCWCCRR